MQKLLVLDVDEIRVDSLIAGVEEMRALRTVATPGAAR